MRCLLLALAVVCCVRPAQADLFIRVVDTGAGLCCVIRTHSDEYIVYDFGHWNGQGLRAFNGVRDMVPDGTPISLAVMSHTDSDHLGGVKRVFDAYQVNKVVHSSLERDTGTWEATMQAIADEPDCEDVDLATSALPGPIEFGEAKLTFVAGWNEPPEEWGLSGGEFFNAGSICIRIEYAGKAVLLCGDAVGRHLGSASSVCIATEEFMCDNAAVTPIASDVLIAPHHGADNGSSTRFVEEVSPKWVVFSAGHNYQHPTASAVNRFLTNGVALAKIFRTDLGDDESGSGPFEWSHGRVSGQTDQPGDDDVDIRIKPSGAITVKYRHDNSLSFTDPAAAPWNVGVPKELLEQEALPAEVLIRQEYGEDYIDDDVPPRVPVAAAKSPARPCPTVRRFPCRIFHFPWRRRR